MQSKILQALKEKRSDSGLNINQIADKLNSKDIMGIKVNLEILEQDGHVFLSKNEGKIKRAKLNKGEKSMITNSKVNLQKKNGELINEIPAFVGTNSIIIKNANLPIEEGDHISRIIKNGLEEIYLVLDRGYIEKTGGFPAHYQCKVKKKTSMDLEQPKQVIYNLYGSNSRVNNNSTDQSINIVDMSSGDLFDEIRKVLKEEIQNEEEKQELRAIVNELEINQGTNKFNKLYTNFITSAANHMTVISPFIPALSQMLQG